MDLEIQTRRLDMEPAWRTLIEQQAGRLGERHPELLRMHVTLSHGRHHRRGYEAASIVANLAGTTLSAAKEEASVRMAIQSAFMAIAREIRRQRRMRWRTRRTRAANDQQQGAQRLESL